MGTLVGIVAAILLALCLLASSGCSPSNPPSGGKSGSSEEIVGAMCYKVSVPRPEIAYICPKCGERTVYDGDTPTVKEVKAEVIGVVAKEIASCRREFAELRKVAGDTTMSLDESQFCRKCSPNVTEPKLVLYFSYQGKPREIKDISRDDLQILREFFAGRPLKENGATSKKQLEHRRHRLEQLLGVKLEK
jgi:hypothetical protein